VGDHHQIGNREIRFGRKAKTSRLRCTLLKRFSTGHKNIHAFYTFQLKELKERQKQQLRHKALKKGLDPEALTGKYPVRQKHIHFAE
jgi:hypothetical protein